MTADEPGLAALRHALEADGYQLDLEEDAGRLVASISATPWACDDCLVPKPVMLAMIEQALGVPQQSIDLRYPGEGR
jgi:hypothetical protein